jgi:hypothetical protein
MQRKLCATGIIVSGVLMFIGGFAHALAGWPALSAALDAQHVDSDLIAAIAIGWMFGSTAMLALGIIVLMGFRAVRRGVASSRIGPFVAGAAYLVFGTGALFYRFPNLHFLPFIVVGAILCTSLFAYPGSDAE